MPRVPRAAQLGRRTPLLGGQPNRPPTWLWILFWGTKTKFFSLLKCVDIPIPSFVFAHTPPPPPAVPTAAGGARRDALHWLTYSMELSIKQEETKRHSDIVTGLSWSDAGELLTVSDDKTVRVWNTEGEPQSKLTDVP
eukprot:scaffold13664_cov89-Isochrysis_galbana.AAC.3